MSYTPTANERAHYSGPFAGHAKFKTPEEEYVWAKGQKKKCRKCLTDTPLTEFNTNTSGKDPFDKNGYRLRRGECRTCSAKDDLSATEAKRLARQLGISYKAPEGTACKICAKTEKLVFDHCHATNTFRGYICNECNRSIGMLGDTVASLLKVINYLNETEKKVFVVDPATGILRAE